jgi:hypothetical protein
MSGSEEQDQRLGKASCPLPLYTYTQEAKLANNLMCLESLKTLSCKTFLGNMVFTCIRKLSKIEKGNTTKKT